MPAIIDELIEDHRRFGKFLGWYQRELEKLRTGGEPDYHLLEQLAEYFSLFPDELHHKKEDIVYDFLIESDDHLSTSASQGNEKMRDLRADHEKISDAAETVRTAFAQVVAGEQLPKDELTHQATTYMVMLQRHMSAEEESFFPRALAALDDKDWKKVDKALEKLLSEKTNAERTRQVLNIEERLADEYG